MTNYATGARVTVNGYPAEVVEAQRKYRQDGYLVRRLPSAGYVPGVDGYGSTWYPASMVKAAG